MEREVQGGDHRSGIWQQSKFEQRPSGSPRLRSAECGFGGRAWVGGLRARWTSERSAHLGGVGLRCQKPGPALSCWRLSDSAQLGRLGEPGQHRSQARLQEAQGSGTQSQCTRGAGSWAPSRRCSSGCELGAQDRTSGRPACDQRAIAGGAGLGQEQNLQRERHFFVQCGLGPTSSFYSHATLHTALHTAFF